ncbi:MAG: flagellar hook-basal body complex protein FliE [Pseudomonadota bacterium]
MTAITPVAWMPELSVASATSPERAGVSSTDFGKFLKSGVTTLTEQMDRASELLSAYAVGEPISPHELVMAMEQAKLSMQLAVEVRNRLVDAYQELTRLQI